MKRYDASESMPSFLLVARIAAGRKFALSSSTSVVVSLIPLCSPPITPATAIGLAASAITSICGSSARSTPSRVRIFSPGFGCRTTMRPSASSFWSNACRGCPHSSMT